MQVGGHVNAAADILCTEGSVGPRAGLYVLGADRINVPC
jgi:hypothetical protein